MRKERDSLRSFLYYKFNAVTGIEKYNIVDGINICIRRELEKGMSKVIFLDIDGVLNRHHWRYGTREKSPMGFVGVGQKHINILKQIVEETGAYVVLSSDWKMCFKDMDCNPETANEDGRYLVRRLRENGIDIVEKTDDRSVGDDYSTGRGYGIRKYLALHPEVTDYVILDDCRFSDFTDELVPHFLHLKYPLSGRSLKQAIKILNISQK